MRDDKRNVWIARLEIKQGIDRWLDAPYERHTVRAVLDGWERGEARAPFYVSRHQTETSIDLVVREHRGALYFDIDGALPELFKLAAPLKSSGTLTQVECEAGREAWVHRWKVARGRSSVKDSESTWAQLLATDESFAAADRGYAAWLSANPDARRRREQSERWGYVDGTGRWVIPPDHRNVTAFSEGLGLVYDDGVRSRFIDASGRLLLTDERWGDGRSFSEGIAAVEFRTGSGTGLWGYVDTQGHTVVEPRFFAAYDFKEGVARVQQTGGPWGGPYRYIDRTGKPITEDAFDVGALDFTEGFGWGWSGGRARCYDRAGKRAFGADFATASVFSEGLAAVGVGSKAGYVDATGALVIPAVFDAAYPFAEGRARVHLEGKARVIDRTGKVLGVATNTGPTEGFAEGLMPVMVKGKFGFVDREGEVVIKPRFHSAQGFREGLAVVSVSQRADLDDLACGFIDREGKMVIEPTFDVARPMCGGRAAVKLGVSVAHRSGRVGGLWGIVDRTGAWIATPRFDELEGGFEGGLVPAREP